MPAWGQNIYFNKVQPPIGKFFQHITGMVQDKQGYMWLASKNGLFRYDGYQMIHYRNNPLDANSLGSDYLETICLDSAGMIWIGTFNSGLDRLDPTTVRFTHFRHDPANTSSIISNSILALCTDRTGTLWIGSEGLERFNPGDNSFTHYGNVPNDVTSLSDNNVRSIYEDHQGVLWIGTGSVYGVEGADPSKGGLNRMDKGTGKFTRYKHDEANPSSLVNNKVRALFEDSKGNFWVGTAGDGLHIMNRATGSFERFRYDPNDPTKLSRPALKPAPFYDHITFITEDVMGGIWIGTAESGINLYNPTTRRIKHFESGKDTAGSFDDFTAWWSYRSREGVLWISTVHGNLYRINSLEGSVPFYPIQSNNVSSVYVDADGTTWVGTTRDGLLHNDKSGNLLKKYIHESGNPNSLSSNEVSCVNVDSDGKLWVGTFSGGLNQFNKENGTFTRYSNSPDNSNSICNNTVFGIYNKPGEALWVCTLNGLSRFDKSNGSFRNYLFFDPKEPDDERNIITSVLKDRDSRWWVGCWNKAGIQQLNPETGKFKTYLEGASIMRLFEDHTGTLWAAGKEGLYQYNRERDVFQWFEDPVFLTESNDINNLLEDNEGNLWMTTNAGILRLNKERNETTLFGKSYGIDGNNLFSMTASKGPDGKLYFGNRYQAGYFSFFPHELTSGMKAPEININGFRIANKLIMPGEDGILKEPIFNTSKIRLNHDQNVFSFEFAGIDFGNPEDNRHLFMLENYDEGWNLAGSDLKAIYFNVPPGKYVFRVKMVNSYGVWASKSIEVIVTPPWWTTWWFRVAAILMITALLYSIIRWRVRQKFNQQLERSEKDKQLAELRQKTGELEMQALRAQMNPHFVFNSLNAINRFILQNNRTQASEYLTKFSRLVRMILQNSQSTLITLESEIESLKLYLELEALRFSDHFEYQLTIPRDMDIEILKVPPLIIQPYAENAIWHGLMHKEEKGHLFIDIRQENNHLILTVKDDGIGRKHSATMTSKTATKHKSMGLKITADRIALLQRSTTADSSVVINDLVHADGTAAGTEVIIKIPVIYD